MADQRRREEVRIDPADPPFGTGVQSAELDGAAVDAAGIPLLEDGVTGPSMPH